MEEALLSVVQEAYVHGVSTRKVDDIVRALGIDGISRSEVSRICAALYGSSPEELEVLVLEVPKEVIAV